MTTISRPGNHMGAVVGAAVVGGAAYLSGELLTAVSVAAGAIVFVQALAADENERRLERIIDLLEERREYGE